ncbi:MAG: hypothetical protein F6K47_26550, partial [Symploca sp. SIO2E6]|nr:hypothetical protein [Symploca sp. SIO2E6]
ACHLSASDDTREHENGKLHALYVLITVTIAMLLHFEGERSLSVWAKLVNQPTKETIAQDHEQW